MWTSNGGNVGYSVFERVLLKCSCRLFATCRENRSLLKARTAKGPDSSVEGNKPW